MTRTAYSLHGLPLGFSPRIIETGLLIMCLAVLALRVIFTEGPPMSPGILPLTSQDPVQILASSTVLIFVWGMWLALRGVFWGKVPGTGLVLFMAAAVISCTLASDKRLAINAVVVFVSPILVGMVLADMVRDQGRRRWVLATIAVLGAAWSLQCLDQVLVSDRTLIRQYEQDPNSLLEPLGIEAGTAQHFLLEHRLYSKGSRGAFTTRNSAGAFGLVALFAVMALVADALQSRTQESRPWIRIGLAAFAGSAVLAGLGLTRSKGALLGLGIAGLGLTCMLLWGRRIHARRWALLAGTSVVGILLALVLAWYGASHETLPGGQSMSVRWEYWQAAGRMIADHPLGIGPGNFGLYYHRYRPPAALETVADPHNIILSLMAQFGPLGLVGFLILVLTPTWRGIFNTDRANKEGLVLGFGVVAVMVASMFDFVLFEPGVNTGLWFLIGLVPALRPEAPYTTPARRYWAGIAAVLALVVGLLVYAQFLFWPVTRCTSKIDKAHEAIARGEFSLAHSLLLQATADDPLSPNAPALDAMLYIRQAQANPAKDPRILHMAIACLDLASQRNPADFRNLENLAEAYGLLDDQSNAARTYRQALELFPGCDRLWLGLARSLDKAGHTDQAVQAYRKAVLIEDQFQAKLRQTYPERKAPVSRLGFENYRQAKERINALTQARPEPRPGIE